MTTAATTVEFTYPANVPGFRPGCAGCLELIGTAPPDPGRTYRIFHDGGHDLCPDGEQFAPGGLLGDWELEVEDLEDI